MFRHKRGRACIWLHASLIIGLLLALFPVLGVQASSSGNWSSTGSMPNPPRARHTATLLPNGKVLVAGGGSGYYDGPGYSAALYDPATGTWTATGDMTTARTDHTATLLNDGKVLVAGGTSDGSAELYDPATGTWSSTGSMSMARTGHTATLLPNGKVLVAGGDSYPNGATASAELYDPATGRWSSTGSMTTPRAGHTATLLNNGKVLVVGGTNNGSSELYDPSTGTWSSTGSLPVARGDHTATLLTDGRVLVVGNPVDAAEFQTPELYDPTTGTWSSTGSMSAAVRYFQTATLLPSGKVLVAGGTGENTGDGQHMLASAELYDLATGTWSSAGSMKTARTNHTATLLPNGTVLVAGGWSDNDYYLQDFTSAEIYTPADASPPTTTASATDADNTAYTFGHWINQAVTVTLKATDNMGGSGVATTYYGIDTTACTPSAVANCSSYSGPFTIDTEGTHTLTFFSTDKAGNNEALQTQAVKIDKTAPTTTATATKSDGSSYGFGNWTNGTVTITLSPTDNAGGSGIATTYYGVDNATCTPTAPVLSSVCSTSSGPFPISTEGTHSLSYFSIDQAGNKEALQTQVVKIDKTPPGSPTPSFSPAAVYNDGTSDWYKDSVTVSYGGSTDPALADGTAGSGVASYSAAQTFNTTGLHSYSGTATDTAGNVSNATTGSVHVDADPPTIALTTPTNGANFILNQSDTADYGCSDSGSGVASCAGSVADGSNIDTASVGAKTFAVTAADHVGHTSGVTANYTVSYGIKPLYDQTVPHFPGMPILLTLQLTDSNGANVSSPSITVHAENLTPGSLQPFPTNRDNDFSYVPKLGTYVYLLNSWGLTPGTHTLNFTVTGDPVPHAIQFAVW